MRTEIQVISAWSSHFSRLFCVNLNTSNHMSTLGNVTPRYMSTSPSVVDYIGDGTWSKEKKTAKECGSKAQCKPSTNPSLSEWLSRWAQGDYSSSILKFPESFHNIFPSILGIPTQVADTQIIFNSTTNMQAWYH